MPRSRSGRSDRGVLEPEPNIGELQPASYGPGAVAAGRSRVVTVAGESITSKYRWVALAASFDMASSQPIESIGQRKPMATPKNATSVPADNTPSATCRIPRNSTSPKAISGTTTITAQSRETTAAFFISVPRSEPACTRNRRLRCPPRPNAFRMRMPSTDSSTMVARSPTWSWDSRASDWYCGLVAKAQRHQRESPAPR